MHTTAQHVYLHTPDISIIKYTHNIQHTQSHTGPEKHCYTNIYTQIIDYIHTEMKKLTNWLLIMAMRPRLTGEESSSIEFGTFLWYVYAGVSCALVLFAGIMSGLTLGLMSLGLVELEILQRSGSPKEKQQAGSFFIQFCLICACFWNFEFVSVNCCCVCMCDCFLIDWLWLVEYWSGVWCEMDCWMCELAMFGFETSLLD